MFSDKFVSLSCDVFKEMKVCLYPRKIYSLGLGLSQKITRPRES